MQIFRLVRITTIAIGWLTKSGHTWFDKHELWQIEHLMGDLRHSHIFTAMLASASQFKIYPFQFIVIFYLIYLNMYNLLVQVFRRILRILISLPLTLRQMAHLNRRRSRRLMTSTYFMEISRRTLS
jgi:hypothetical protein